MMLEVPRLRGHDAVILYRADIKSKDNLKKQKQEVPWKGVQEAVKDSHVKKFLRRKNLQPDQEELGEWIESAQAAE